MRDSQYAEAMVSNYINAYTNTGNILANNMGQGKMAFISRDDCAVAAACAAMSDWQDRVVDVNGYEPLTIGEYIEIANKVTSHNVNCIEISDKNNINSLIQLVSLELLKKCGLKLQLTSHFVAMEWLLLEEQLDLIKCRRLQPILKN